MHKPRNGSIRNVARVRVSICKAIEACDCDINFLLLELDRLYDIPREEQLDRPVHEHANLPLQTGELR
jgi:hypothetical protein